MKLHGKLLICARNESVERERLINIHRGLRRAEVDEWLEQPARLMTQIWVTYPEGGSWKPVTPLPQFLSLEMGLITHKSLAQLQVDQGRAWLERGVLTPQVSQQTTAIVELLTMVMPARKEPEATTSLPLFLF